MKKSLIGLFLGTLAGVLDVIPMIIQGLSWDANLGAFSMWIISGYFISKVELEIHPVGKGIFISLLMLIPSSFIIGWHDPVALIPILAITIVLGGLLGYAIWKMTIRQT